MAKHFQVDTAGTLMTGLLRWYKLQDVTEYSVGSLDLTNNNSVSFSADGADGGSSNSNKLLSRDEISPAGITFAQMASAFSVSFWAKANATDGDDGRFVSLLANDGSHRHQMEVCLSSLTLSVIVYDGASNLYNTTHTFTTGTWYHVVMTYNGATVKVYVDTVQVLSQARVIGSAADGYYGLGILGQNVVSLGMFNFCNGAVNRFGSWSKVVSSQEITDLYNSGAGDTMVDVVPAAKDKMFLVF